jgi:hypothetical protein
LRPTVRYEAAGVGGLDISASDIATVAAEIEELDYICNQRVGKDLADVA